MVEILKTKQKVEFKTWYSEVVAKRKENIALVKSADEVSIDFAVAKTLIHALSGEFEEWKDRAKFSSQEQAEINRIIREIYEQEKTIEEIEVRI